MTLAAIASTCGGTRQAPPADDAASRMIAEARKLDLDGKQSAAIALFRQALARQPDSFDAHYGLGRALDLTGAYDEARQHFARSIELAPESDKEQALRMMGIAWTFAGDAAQASRYFREVFDRRVKERNPAGAAEVANELGRVYLELGDFDNAERWYRTGHEAAGRAADRQPWQVDLADMRWAHAQARIAARRGEAREARRQEAEVKRLLDKGGNDDQRSQYAYLRGYVEFYVNQPRAAVVALAQADQQDPFVLLLLGQASEQLGNREQAAEYYRKVLESSSHAVNSAFARPLARQKLGMEAAAPQIPVRTR
jgi:tetratricopeptide (TPR) repeat protein